MRIIKLLISLFLFVLGIAAFSLSAGLSSVYGWSHNSWLMLCGGFVLSAIGYKNMLNNYNKEEYPEEE